MPCTIIKVAWVYFFETLPDLGGGWIEPISTKYAQVKLDSMFPKHRGEKLKQTFEVSPPPSCPVTALGEWNPIISSTKFQGLEIQQFFFRWPPVTRVTSPEVWHRSQEFFRRTFQAHQKNRPRLLCTQPFFEFVSFRHADVSHLSSIRYLSTRRILPPHMETPDPPNDTPKRASKQVATWHPNQHAKGFLENKTLAERPRFYPQVSMIW